jgi:hypothetical protein
MKLFKLFGILALTLFSIGASASTTITASKIQQDASGTLLASGYFCLTPVSPNGAPTSFTSGTGGQVAPNQVCFAVTSGALSGVSVADTSLITPSGVGYAVQIQNSTHNTLYSYSQPIFPSGSTWSLDSWSPSVSYNVSPVGVQFSFSAPQGRCAAPSIDYTSSTLYSCVGSIWVSISSGGGGSGTLITSGDVSVTSGVATVIALQGFSVATTAPTTGQNLTWNGSHYAPTTPSVGTTIGSGDVAVTGTNAVVQGLQGIGISTSAPTSGQFLAYSVGANQYIPTTPSTAATSIAGINVTLTGSEAAGQVLTLTDAADGQFIAPTGGTGGGIVNSVVGASGSPGLLTELNGGSAANPTLTFTLNPSGSGGELVTTIGLGTSTNCLQADGNGNVIASSSVNCGGVTPSTQYKMSYYQTGGNTVGGSNITTDSSGNDITIPGTETLTGAVNGWSTFTYVGATAPTPPANSYQVSPVAAFSNPVTWSPDNAPTTGIPFDTVTLNSGVEDEVQSHIALPSCPGGQVLTVTSNVFSCVAATSAPSATTFSIKEEFASGNNASGTIGEYGWLNQNIVGSATYAGATSSANPGLEQITTPATSGDGGGLYLGSTNTLTLGSINNWTSEWIADVSNVTVIAFRIGYFSVDTSALIPTNGVYFRFDKSLGTPDTHIMGCVDVSGTETCASTGVTPVAGTYYDFNSSSTTAGTISFSVSGSTPVTICASGCTATATPPTTSIGPGATVVATSTTAVTLSLDYFSVYLTGLTR